MKDNGFYGLNNSGELRFKTPSDTIDGLIVPAPGAYGIFSEDDRAVWIDMSTGERTWEWVVPEGELPGEGPLVFDRVGEIGSPSANMRVARVGGEEILDIKMADGKIESRTISPTQIHRSQIELGNNRYFDTASGNLIFTNGEPPLVYRGPGLPAISTDSVITRPLGFQSIALVFDEINQRAILMGYSLSGPLKGEFTSQWILSFSGDHVSSARIVALR